MRVWYSLLKLAVFEKNSKFHTQITGSCWATSSLETGFSWTLTFRDVQCAVRPFKPFKFPGPDGIIPGGIQHGQEINLPWLFVIYNAILRLLYISLSWKISSVIFIPKAGKPSHTRANDYRPINLSSFLLKTLERVLDIRIRASTDPALLRDANRWRLHYTLLSLGWKGPCTLKNTLYSVLYIEGAFNNVNPDALIRNHGSLNLLQKLLRFIDSFIDRYFHSLIPNRDDWNVKTVISPELLDT